MAYQIHKRLLSAAILAAVSCVVFAGTAVPTHVAGAGTAMVNSTALAASGHYDRFIIQYRQGTAEAGNRSMALQNVGVALNLAGLSRMTVRSAAGGSTGAVYVRKLAVGSDVVRTARLDKAQALAFMTAVASDPAVAHVQPDVMMHAVGDYRATSVKGASVQPDDSRYASYQWDLHPGDGTTETVGRDTVGYANRSGTNITRAWDLADGHDVTVAVLDTGITHHPDLDTSLGDAGYDFISDPFISGRATADRAPGGWDTGDWTNQDPWLSECTDANHPPEASSWHGSHVAGTIAALTNNATGVASSAYGARILPVRVLGHCGGLTSDIVDSIVWAAGGHVDGIPDNAHPAQVINMSLGGSGSCSSSDVWGQAIAMANGLGATVVVAAGNKGIDALNGTPSSCPGVITVASLGISGKRAFYSNYGSAVALAAPGGGIYASDASSGSVVDAGFIWSTVNGSETAPDESDYGYGGMAGTSQATPHVAAAAALVISARKDAGLPALSPAEMKTLLTSTARPFPVKPDKLSGAGMVDPYAAVAKAVGGDGGGDDGDVTTVLNNGDVLNGIAGTAGDRRLYKVDVPAGTTALVLRSFGGSGDVSLYVKRDAAPTANDYDRASVHSGNNESLVITRPAAGTYYLLVSGVKEFAELSVQASYTPR